MSDYWTHAMHLSELPLLSRITCVSSTSRIPMPSCEVCLWGHLLKLQPEFHRLEAFLGAMDPEFRMASSWIPWVVMVSEKIGDIRSKSKKSTRFCEKKKLECKSLALGMTSIWQGQTPRLLRGGCPDNGSLHPRRLEGPPHGIYWLDQFWGNPNDF